MTTAWTKRILVGCCLALPVACVVTVDDDPIDENIGGTSGSTNNGSGGSSGTSNSSGGMGGSSAGQGGTAGSMSMIGNGGGGGSDQVPAPVCTAEAGDDMDACLRCIKAQCCTEWQACNDSTCQQERVDLEFCVYDPQMPESADVDTYSDCIGEVSVAMDGLLAPNSNALMSCVNEVVTEGDAGIETTRCGTECWGVDIFFD
jgi:hypothetical protein